MQHAEKTVLDDVMLRCVDERIEADVQENNEDRKVVDSQTAEKGGVHQEEEIIELIWEPSDGVQQADKHHRLNGLQLSARDALRGVSQG